MKLPLELVNEIIEHLADCPGALRTCTFVCKSWLPVVFRVLFRRLSVDIAIANEIQPEFVFPHHVYDLSIGDFDPWTPFADPTTTFLLFDRVRSLHIKISGVHILPTLLPGTFSHLRELGIDIGTCSIQSLHAFIATFPKLEILFVDGVVLGVHDIEAHSNYPPPPSCLHTVVYKPDGGGLFRWLLAHPVTLEHLTLGSITPDEFRSTSALLRAIGPRLRTLDITFAGLGIIPAQIPILSANTRLHTLRINTGTVPAALRLEITFPLIRTASTTLSCITLLMAASYAYHKRLVVPGWETLDTLLAHRVPTLECFHVCMYGPIYSDTPDLSDLSRLIMAGMPLCAESGMVGEICLVHPLQVGLSTPSHHGRVIFSSNP